MNQKIEPLIHTQVIVVLYQDIVRDPVHALSDRLVPFGQFLEKLVVRLVLIAGPLGDPGGEELQMGHEPLVVPVLVV